MLRRMQYDIHINASQDDMRKKEAALMVNSGNWVDKEISLKSYPDNDARALEFLPYIPKV